MSRRRRPHLFLDSNVLTGGMVSRWGLDKAALALCASGICRLVLAEAVRGEVEENLLIHATGLDPTELLAPIEVEEPEVAATAGVTPTTARADRPARAAIATLRTNDFAPRSTVRPPLAPHERSGHRHHSARTSSFRAA